MLATISRRVSHHNIIVPDVRRKLPLKSVCAFFGLPSACMPSLGILERFLSCNTIDVEARHCNFNINAERGSARLVGIHVALLMVPLPIDFISVGTLIFSFLIRICTVLSDKEMLPKLSTSQSRRLEGIQLPGELLPVNVDRVPQMFGLHMAPFSLERFGY